VLITDPNGTALSKITVSTILRYYFMKAKTSLFLSVLVSSILILPVAEAHTFGAEGAGLSAGLAHPFMGLDHLLAMIAVGIWAWQLGGRAVWFVPVTFVSMMCIAAIFGLSGFSLPLVEPAIACSLLILGLLIAGSVRLPLIASMCLVGLFAVFHGYAHGLELPQAASPVYYGIGFILATATLHGLGIGFAHSSRQHNIIQHIAGCSLIVASSLLLAAA
jgi:urease accessory protein